MKSIICLFSGWLFISLAFNLFKIHNSLITTLNGFWFKENEDAFHEIQNTEVEPYEIVINEIMADPSPSVYLPEFEYLELFNKSLHPVDLKGWTLEAGTRIYNLSGTIDPADFIILTYIPAVDVFREYGNVLGIFTSSVALNNNGQLLILKNGNNEIIDAVLYEDKWYDEPFKAQGGWSLERIDPDNICSGKENWKVSESLSGGSPGKINSVYTSNPDIYPPYIKGIEILGEKEIIVHFNESIDRNFFNSLIPFKIISGENRIVRITPSLPFYNSCIIEFQSVLEGGKIYKLTLGDKFCDCAGNHPDIELSISFGRPLKPGCTDIILTEVLFAPFPGCPEFIEIYNNTDSLLNLSDIVIGISNDNNPKEIKREYLVNEMSLFFPHEYLVITTQPELLENYYEIKFPERLFQMKKMPALKDAGGCIELTDRSLQLLDRFCYSVQNHYSLLNDYHGVSLERINIDKSPGFLSKWHSASSNAGFATPGYKNSQDYNYLHHEKLLNIEPELFTPDNDGKDDIVVISYFISEEGYTGNVIVFDAYGRQIKHLAQNELLGVSGFFIWDGTNDLGQLNTTGLYLIYFEAFNLKGNRLREKQTVILIR